MKNHGYIDLENIMVSASHSVPIHNISAEHISKLCIIDLQTASSTIYITPQNCGGGGVRNQNCPVIMVQMIEWFDTIG